MWGCMQIPIGASHGTMVGPAHVGACLGPHGQVFVALTPHEQKQCLAL